jgi:intraflagellar transport protein 56
MAWQQYLNLDGSEDSYKLLQLIANDCYKAGQFYYAAKVGTWRTGRGLE